MHKLWNQGRTIFERDRTSILEKESVTLPEMKNTLTTTRTPKKRRRMTESCNGRYILELVDGGLTNEIQRIYNAYKRARDNNYTLILPHVFSTACVFDVRHLNNQTTAYVESFDFLFDKKAFCNVLAEEGICHECTDFPSALNHLTDEERLKFMPDKCTNDILLTDFVYQAEGSTLHPDAEGMNFFLGQDSFTVIESEYEDYAKFAAKLVPNEQIKQVVDAFKEKLGGEYVAVHMRVEEDWESHGDCYIDADTIVSMMTKHHDFIKMQKSVSQTGGTLKVFIASGDQKRSRAAWEKVPGVEIVDAEKEKDSLGLAWNQRALVDQSICMEATQFTGAKSHSSFTDLVTFVRKYALDKHGSYAYVRNPDGSNGTMYDKYDRLPYYVCDRY
mmetsp:Transcript_16577/g.29744  ORF Transcript_16577/g.29744 Transcript_16577/m.29744 type:complete len:388 (+) Transcript_16577:804-1967(+)